MSVSRKGKVIALANSRSARLIDACDGEKTAENLEAIRGICSGLVQRPTPEAPTAKNVASQGKATRPSFPSSQTIYNAYASMLKIWRRAYEDIRNIDAPDPVPTEDLDKIDLHQFDVSKRALVQDLIMMIRELTRRNNALKRLISESVPTPADDLPHSADEVIRDLSVWLNMMASGAFDLDDIGLKVSQRTPIRTLVMSLRLFNALRTLTDDYQLAVKARAARAA
jgi:hypothetical protein